MRRVLGLACLLGLLLQTGSDPAAAADPIVYRGARILTAEDQNYDPGAMVVEDGKITAIGPADQIQNPAGAKVVDLSGKVVIPGLVDTHSHLGVHSRPHVPSNSDGNEMTGPVQSVVRALDAVNPFDPGFRMALAGGVTTANVMPGSGNVIGGQTVYIKLRGHTAEQMWIAADGVLGGLKMANGENPKRSYGGKGQAPGTRMKVAALQRRAFVEAREYQRKWEAYRQKNEAGEEAEPPARNLELEPLVEVLEGKRTVHFHTHRADDIMTTLRLAEEFGFELVVQHGTEGYKVAEELARRKVPVSMTVVDSPGGKAEVVDFIEECGAQLSAQGVKVLINTDDSITESRFFLRTAAIPVRGGLSEELALKAITLYSAQAMHLDQQLGSLAAGKDADFVVLSGAPFSVYTRVLATYLDGKQVFDLEDDEQARYQTGGFAVAERALRPAPRPLIEPRQAVAAPASPAGAKAPTEESQTVVVLAGRLHTISQGVIEDGAVLIKDGKLDFVGKRGDLQIPAGAAVVAAAEVTPGLIDAHSVVPLAGEYNISADQDNDERSDPNQADVRVHDGFNPREPLLRFLLEQGVTVVHATPGRANVIAGTTGVYRTHGTTVEEMAIRSPHAMLFNLGAIPKTTYSGKRPGTRMGTAAMLRTALAEASNYAQKIQRAEADEKDPPERNLKHEALAGLMDGKLRAMFCAQRADDIVTALRLAGEFKLDAQIALAAEAYLIPEQVKQAGVPIILHPTMQRVGAMETFHSYLGSGAALADQGIRVAIGSGVEGYVPKSRVIRHEAAIAMVYGMGFDRALRSVTLDAAQILGIADRFGSLEAGKEADIVLYDGDPFEHKTHVTHVFVGGKLRYDRAVRQQIPFAIRARFGVGELPCCLW